MAGSAEESTELWGSLRQSDEDALATLLSPHWGRLLRLLEFRMDARLCGRVEAEDVLQEAYLDAAKRTYFCPERQDTYFGSFYLKNIPAMGSPGYTIDEDLTGRSGETFLTALTDTQAELVTGSGRRNRTHQVQLPRLAINPCPTGLTLDSWLRARVGLCEKVVYSTFGWTSSVRGGDVTSCLEVVYDSGRSDSNRRRPAWEAGARRF